MIPTCRVAAARRFTAHPASPPSRLAYSLSFRTPYPTVARISSNVARSQSCVSGMPRGHQNIENAGHLMSLLYLEPLIARLVLAAARFNSSAIDPMPTNRRLKSTAKEAIRRIRNTPTHDNGESAARNNSQSAIDSPGPQ